MIGTLRMDNIRMCIEDVLEKNVPGDMIETGAWRGGATIFMRAVLKCYGVTDRIVWLADSFEGLPKPTVERGAEFAGTDLSHVDFLKVSLEEVQENFRRFGMLDNQVRFVKGWFRDTLPHAGIARIAVLRLDGDLYESTADALNALYGKVSAGGFVIVDDYLSWKSCKRGVDDFRNQNAIAEKIVDIDGSGVYWRVERSLQRTG
jgi:hypothetical protein